MNALELKFPPPLVAIGCGLLMWFASRLFAPPGIPLAYRAGAGGAIALTGLVIALAGVVSFRLARTTVNPTRPASASALVSTGVYRFTRNPMYLGLLLALLGWTAFLASAAALLLAPLFVLYLNRFQIAPEERALASLFGEEFAAYRKSVRRWV